MNMANEIEKTNVKELMWSADSLQSFIRAVGSEYAAKQYIQSVLIEVASNEDLQECTPRSIMKSALDAATLGLSCSKSLKQAWLVPFDVKVKARNVMRGGVPATIPEHYEKQATFIPHYKGLRNLAMRTGKYLIINVSPVYKGQRVFEDALTGLHSILDDGSSILTQPESYNPAHQNLIDVTDRRRKSLDRVGWIGYYKAKNGEQKSVYWSLADIDDHARAHVKGYLDKDGNIKNLNWRNEEKRAVMEMKTVLRDLLSWTDKSGTEGAMLTKAMQADEPESNIVDGDASEPEKELRSSNPDPVTDATWKAWNNIRAKAETFEVAYKQIERDAVTEADLIAYLSELTPFVLDAEQQAKS
jgi:recombination protein RecT